MQYLRLVMATVLAALICAIATITLSPDSANSAVISLSDPVFGPDSITLDTDSDLEWLDLPLTQGAFPPDFRATISHDDVIAGLVPGGLYDGFRLPSEAEVEFLLTQSFGISITAIVNTFIPVDLDAANRFIDFFGQTGLIGSDNARGSAGRFEFISPTSVNSIATWEIQAGLLQGVGSSPTARIRKVGVSGQTTGGLRGGWSLSRGVATRWMARTVPRCCHHP